MNVQKVRNIIKLEVIVNLTKWKLLLLVIAPLLILAIPSAIIFVLMAFFPPILPVGIVDMAGLLSGQGEICSSNQIGRPVDVIIPAYNKDNGSREGEGHKMSARCFPDIATAKAALFDKKTSNLFVISPTFVADLGITVYGPDSALLKLEGQSRYLEEYLSRELIKESSIDEPIKRFLLERKPVYNIVNLNSNNEVRPSNEPIKNGNIETPVARILMMALGIWGVFIFGLSIASGIECTRTERTTRLIEVVLSSVTAMEFLMGKILGAFIVISVVATGWLLVSGLIFSSLTPISLGDLLNAWSIPHTEIVLLIVVSAICLGLVGAIVGITGSKGKDGDVSFGISRRVAMGIFYFLMLIAFVDPTSRLTLAMSFIPPFAGPTMIGRMYFGGEEVPLVQMLISLVCIIISVAIFLFAAAKLLRMTLAIEGQRLTPYRIWQVLRS